MVNRFKVGQKVRQVGRIPYPGYEGKILTVTLVDPAPYLTWPIRARASHEINGQLFSESELRTLGHIHHTIKLCRTT